MVKCRGLTTKQHIFTAQAPADDDNDDEDEDVISQHCMLRTSLPPFPEGNVDIQKGDRCVLPCPVIYSLPWLRVYRAIGREKRSRSVELPCHARLPFSSSHRGAVWPRSRSDPTLGFEPRRHKQHDTTRDDTDDAIRYDKVQTPRSVAMRCDAMRFGVVGLTVMVQEGGDGGVNVRAIARQIGVGRAGDQRQAVRRQTTGEHGSEAEDRTVSRATVCR